MIVRILLDPKAGEGGGGGGGNNPGGNGGGSNVDLSTVGAGLLAKNGNDHMKVITHLLKENHRYRRTNSDLQAKVPADGTVVLKGDEVKAWESYKALGDHKEVTKRLTAGDAAVKELGDIQTAKSYDEAASALGYKPGLFSRLAKQDGLAVKVTEAAGQDGKPVKTVSVVGQDGKETSLASYVEANWKDVAGDLAAGEATQPTRRAGAPAPSNNNTPPPRPGEGNPVNPDEQARADMLRTGRYSF